MRQVPKAVRTHLIVLLVFTLLQGAGCAPILLESHLDPATGMLSLTDSSYKLPPSAYTILKSGRSISKVIVGMWKVDHTAAEVEEKRDAEIRDMRSLAVSGFTTFDLADHSVAEGGSNSLVVTGTLVIDDFEVIGRKYVVEDYAPVEALAGAFVESLGGAEAARQLNVSFHNHWVPKPGPLHARSVRKALKPVSERMAQPTLDLVSVHVWDDETTAHLTTMRSAAEMVHGGVGSDPPLLAQVGLTNFDTASFESIADAMPGDELVSLQVAYSLVDTRPADGGMVAAALKRGVKLLTYGSTLGGLLTERWLGQPEPGFMELRSPTLAKYYTLVKSWSRDNWSLFQELLATLDRIAKHHGSGATVQTIATRWVLQQPAVGAVILGARLGREGAAARFIAERSLLFDIELSEEDLASISAVQRRAQPLLEVYGDCGHEYR